MNSRCVDYKELKKYMKSRDMRNETPLTVPKAAEFLGMTISALYAMIQRQLIPFHKLSGRRIRLFKEELIAFLELDINK